MKRPVWILCLALLPIVSVAQAAKITLPSFDALAARATETVNITLDGDTLQSAGGFLGGRSGDAARDAEVAQIVKGLEGIQIRVFNFDKPGMYSPADIEPVLAQVQAPGWKSLLQVRDGEERVEMWLRERNAGGGFLLVAAEPKELVIINIAGDVDLQKLSRLQGKMGIPALPGAPPAPPAPPAPGAPPAPATPPEPPATL